ncbi:MAG: hypothetical protein JWP76_4141, partial [Dactylosporangium sp.]|nr:hypothetical protein [Dactylosporangium sp.]
MTRRVHSEPIIALAGQRALSLLTL